MTNFRNPVKVTKKRSGVSEGAQVAAVVAGGFFAVVLGIAIFIGLLFLVAWLVLLNLQDIQNNGLSFWPVFWLVIILTALFRGSSWKSKS